MTTYGGETVRFFEIDQPLCTRTYGVAPCGAVLGVTGAHKCRNTRFTCQDSANYDPGVLTLRFGMAQEGFLQNRAEFGVVIPSMTDLKTTPGSINLAGLDRSTSALGSREVVSVVLQDHRHSDHQVDKYRLERKTGAASIPVVTYDPYTQGTFWGKWIARNPYWTTYACRVREGFLGQALDEMRVRHYILDRVDGPNEGEVKITAKDLFSVIEARKAVAPLPSQGELLADITAVAAGGTLAPAGIGDEEYPASGHIRIGDESIAFTRVADVLTFTTRGALGSVADEHKAEDLVQLVLTFTAQLAVDIVYTLAASYSEIPAASIPKTTWDVLTADVTGLYTANITEPTEVNKLIAELELQAGFTVWPDVSTGELPLAVLRPAAASVVVDDDDWIIDGTLSLRRQDEKRVSRVEVHYGLINPNEDLEDARNYRSRYITPDLPAEGPTQYGTMARQVIKSRWIPQFGRQLAADLGERILAIYRDPPREAEFAIYSNRDGELELARSFNLRVAENQDANGEILDLVMVPVKLERGLDQIDCTAQEIRFTGGTGLGGNDRTIYLENEDFNLNLRTIHDSLFAVPTGVETVTFIGVAGFTCGSRSTALEAIDTGDWPAGCTLNLVTAGFRIQGAAGSGGVPGNGVAATPGTPGGDALRVRRPINIDNLGGELFGGAGGGGGGGGQTTPTLPIYVGSAGGGGAGTLAGGGAPAGVFGGVGWNPGANGTRDAGGAGGAGTTSGAGSGGKGGDGGAPGLAGQNGTDASGAAAGTGAAGGAPGRYVVGNSFVTWINNGDRRGGVA